MATSDTDIMNMALAYLGASLIIDRKDPSQEALICDLNYDEVRDSVLEDVNWSFAIKRFVLSSPLVDKPAYRFANAFEVPPEVLRVICLDDDRPPMGGVYPMSGRFFDNSMEHTNIPWVLEEGKILTDAMKINFRAIIRVTDPNKFTKSFVGCLAARLASEIALPITNSPDMQARMVDMYMGKKRWAQANDGRQGLNQVRFSPGFVR